MARRQEPVELAVRLASDDDGKEAIAVTDGTMETRDGHRRPKWFWLPRSQILSRSEMDRDGYFEITIPYWLAEERGLI